MKGAGLIAGAILLAGGLVAASIVFTLRSNVVQVMPGVYVVHDRLNASITACVFEASYPQIESLEAQCKRLD